MMVPFAFSLLLERSDLRDDVHRLRKRFLVPSKAYREFLSPGVYRIFFNVKNFTLKSEGKKRAKPFFFTSSLRIPSKNPRTTFWFQLKGKWVRIHH